MKKIIGLLLALSMLLIMSCENEAPSPAPEPPKTEPKDCKVELVVTSSDVFEYTIKEGEYFSIPEDVLNIPEHTSDAVCYISDENAKYVIDDKALITRDTVFTVHWSNLELVVDADGTVTGVTGDSSVLAIPKKVGDKEIKAIGSEFLKENNNVRFVIIQEGVEKIEASAFKGSNIVWVVLPSSIKEVGVDAFYTPGVSNIIYLTGGMKPEWTDGWNNGFEGLLISTEYFIDENGLKYAKSLDFEGNEVLVVDGYFNKGRTLEIPATADGMKVWGISKAAFKNNETLRTVLLPEGLEYIGDYAFDKSNIANIHLPDSLKKIGVWSFAEMPNLTEIKLPDNIKVLPFTAFYSSTSLKKIKLPAYLEEIGEWALSRIGLEYDELVLPDSVKNIRKFAFQSVPNVKRIVLPEGVKLTGVNVFDKWKAEQIISFATQADIDAASKDWNKNCAAIIEVRDQKSTTVEGTKE